MVAPVGFDLAHYKLPDEVEDPSAVNLAIKACLIQPKRPVEICAKLGLGGKEVRHQLKSMARSGQIERIGYALYGLPDAPRPAAMAGRPVRTQPIRDAILAYVTEPRRACEVAAHITRPIATTTGHLAKMKRLGLIVQTERGVYLRANRDRTDLKERRLGIAA